MATYNSQQQDAISRLESQAIQAHRAGRVQEYLACWNRILEIDPVHVRTLTAVGQHAFQRADFQGALDAFKKVTDSSGTDPQDWVNLALAYQQLGQEKDEASAIERALKIAPDYLLALLLKGARCERMGLRHDAARAFGAAAAVAPNPEHLPPDLRAPVQHARTYKQEYDRMCGEFLDAHLEATYKAFSGENLKRFRDSVDIMVGRKRRYDSWSHGHHYPGLPAIEFLDREEFPWLDAFEKETDSIREEFLEILKSEDGFTPYISYPDGMPLNQWAELNNSPRWSAFHMFKHGKRLDANADRAPRTMALLATAPQPVQPGRTPAAMFSLLKPKTRIPPHTGISNARLVTHVPLIIPENCGFRVGNETRQWVPGQAFVFDDTIEHEAWNDSDKLRVVLIFDIWHPMLSEAERALISMLADGLNRFTGELGGSDL